LGIARVIVWIIDAVCFVAMVALGFAFFLLLFGANPSASFTVFVYTVARPFMTPFMSVFPGELFAWTTGTVGYVNLGIVVAFVVYAILSGVVSWIYSSLSGAYYRRQAQSSIARDVATISAASATAAAAAAAQAQAVAQAQAAVQAQATASVADMPPEVAPAPPSPLGADGGAPTPYPPPAQPPAPGGTA